MTEYRKWPCEELARYLSRHEWPHRNALELGCGNGRNLWLLAEHDFAVTGVDHDEQALDEAEDYLCDRQVFDARLVLNALPGPLFVRDAAMNLVVDCQTLQHLTPDAYAATLLEVARVLAPDGRFWSMLWAFGDQESVYPLHPELHVRTVSHVTACYLQMGLQVVAIECTERSYHNQTHHVGWHLIEAVKR